MPTCSLSIAQAVTSDKGLLWDVKGTGEMRPIVNGNGQAHEDLSKRLADNVLEALVDYLAAPGAATSEHVRTISAALQALSVLAIAEQVQGLVAVLADEGRVAL